MQKLFYLTNAPFPLQIKKALIGLLLSRALYSNSNFDFKESKACTTVIQFKLLKPMMNPQGIFSIGLSEILYFIF